MKFEKINDDKIKITLSSADLEANDLDLHSFMSDSSETQSLFLSVLDKAEKDYGFITDNYQPGIFVSLKPAEITKRSLNKDVKVTIDPGTYFF